MRYKVCGDGEIYCPICGANFKIQTWESQIGSQSDCKRCGETLEITEIDYSRSLYWASAKEVLWREFCKFWYTLGMRVRFDSMRDDR